MGFMDYKTKLGGVKSVGDNSQFYHSGVGSPGIAGSPLQNAPTGMADWTPANSPEFESIIPATGGFTPNALPEVQGGWFDMEGKGGMLLGGAQVGLGVYKAMEQSKQNEFMRGYYQNQMNLQKTDFMNSAKSTNNELAAREGRRLDATQGLAYDSAANLAARDNYMKNWGVKETF